MLTKLLLLVLVMVFAINLNAQIFTKTQMNKIAGTEYKIKMIGDAMVGVRADGYQRPPSTASPVIMPPMPNSNFTLDGPDAWNISIVNTGGNTMYDLCSNSAPEYLQQDPNTPDNIHLVYAYSPIGDPAGYPNRRTKYWFSSNRGTSWSFVGQVNDLRSGFPAIAISSESKALVGNHAITTGNPAIRGMFYYDSLPGLGSFKILDPATTTNRLIWVKLTTTQTVNLTQKYIFAGATSGADSSFRSYGLSLTSSTFGPIIPTLASTAEAYFPSRGADGRIGFVFLYDAVNIPAEAGSIGFMESTDNGLTFSLPMVIFRQNINTDSLGAMRGLQMCYIGNIPKVVFETVKQIGTTYFPLAPAKIRFWSTSLPGSDPNRSIQIASNFPGGNVWLPHDSLFEGINDAMGTLSRPTIGCSGSGLVIAFMSITNRYFNSTPTQTNYKAVYVTASSNGGSTWGPPRKITPDSPVRDFTFPSISQRNDTTALNYYGNMIICVDSIPGTQINGAIASLAQFHFYRVTIPKTDVLGVHNISSEVPSSFSLSQNYPNPFNPTTTIRYSIPSLSSPRIDPLSSPRILGGEPVSLKVYDILGKEIATLVNEKQSPGTYEVTFDASQYPSGVYFYKLTTSGYTNAKSMILLK
ncbi:T9SS C-terminal target domain-containing protein [bacterium]|nr:MAG: T9SS C-terminal target domain-containing protein [bacterium]